MIGPQVTLSRETVQGVVCDEESGRKENSAASGPVKVRVSVPAGKPGGSKIIGPVPIVPMERLPKSKITEPVKPFE